MHKISRPLRDAVAPRARTAYWRYRLTAIGTLALAAVFPTSHAVAQTSAGGPITTLTLKQAVDITWARQPESRSVSARRDAAAASVQVARSWTPEPMSMELSLKTDRFTSNNGGREVVAGLSAPLWLPGERQRSTALAQAEQQAIDGRMAAALWRTAGAVREAWWALHLANIDMSAAQARQTAAQQLAGDVNRRVKAGDLARGDEHQADAALAAAQAQMAAAAAAQARARQALRTLLGAAPEASLTADVEPIPSASIDALIGAHPVMRELAEKAEIARRTQDLASAQKRANPELAVQATRDRGAFGERYGQSLTVGVRLPFGSDDRRQAKVAQAAADQIEAETQLINERERLFAEADAAAAQVAGLRTAAEAATRRAALAGQTRGYYAKSFSLGETDLPTRLRIELEAAEAERQAARAGIELAQAISAWRQALGLLPG
jgi:outer membrane protein, heavy metal efflux system